MKNVYIAMMVAGFAVLGGITAVSSLQDSTGGLSTETAFATGHVELMVMDKFGNVIQYVQSDNIVTTEGVKSASDLVLGTTLIADEALFDTVIVGTDTDLDGAGIVVTDFVQRSNRLIDENAVIDAAGGNNGGVIIALWDGDNDGGRGDDLNNQTGSITIEQVGLTSGGCSQTACPVGYNTTTVRLFAYQADTPSVGIGQDDTLQVTWTITFATT